MNHTEDEIERVAEELALRAGIAGNRYWRSVFNDGEDSQKISGQSRKTSNSD